MSPKLLLPLGLNLVGCVEGVTDQTERMEQIPLVSATWNPPITIDGPPIVIDATRDVELNIILIFTGSVSDDRGFDGIVGLLCDPNPNPFTLMDVARWSVHKPMGFSGTIHFTLRATVPIGHRCKLARQPVIGIDAPSIGILRAIAVAYDRPR